MKMSLLYNCLTSCSQLLSYTLSVVNSKAKGTKSIEIIKCNLYSLYYPKRVDFPILVCESNLELRKAVESIEQILIFNFNGNTSILYI